MVKIRKRIASIAAAAVMGMSMVSGTCMSASAAYGYVSITATSGSLYNTSGQSRYGSIKFDVLKEATNTVYKTKSNGAVITSGGSPVTATLTGYTNSNAYDYKATGSLYNGDSINSKVFKKYIRTAKIQYDCII